jgi:PAS domain-containing protein
LKDWGKLIHPDDRSSALNSWRQSLEMGAPWNSEHRLPDCRGVYRWFRQRGVPQSEGDDRCIRWYMLLTEIDQHKNTEERLRESEAFLLHAQRLSLTGSWKHDLSSGEVSITPEMARIYAIQPHEVATTVEFFVNRIHPEDRPDIESKYARALLDKCDFTTDFRIVLGDGSIRQIHNAAHPKVNEGLDSNGDGSSSAATTIYLLGTHLFVEVDPGAQLPALFSCVVGPDFCLSADQVGVNIAGIGSVFTLVQILNTGEADASGSAGGNFPSVTPGVYDLAAEADPLYVSSTGVVPSGTIVNTIVIGADGPGVSLSPYTFPIPEPGTWMLAGVGVVAFAARKFFACVLRVQQKHPPVLLPKAGARALFA